MPIGMVWPAVITDAGEVRRNPYLRIRYSIVVGEAWGSKDEPALSHVDCQTTPNEAVPSASSSWSPKEKCRPLHIYKERRFTMQTSLLSISQVAVLIGIRKHRLEYALAEGHVPEPKLRFIGKRALDPADVCAIASYFRKENEQCKKEGESCSASST